MLLSIVSQITLIFVILTFIGALVTAGWMILIPKRDVIETSETILKMGLALYTTVVYILFLCFHAIFVSIKYEGKPYIESVIILIAFFPLVYIFFNYFNLNRYFKKKFKLAQIEENEETKICIEKISEDLELKKKPTILFSNYKNISPFVFGKTLKKSYISLPINWNEIFQKISRNNKKIEQNLKCFAIIHELSHIKHRDHIFMGWSYSFLKSFKYWIVAVILAASIFSFIISLSQVRNAFGPIILGIIYYLILYLITMSISRSREYLADARASLLISESELESIVTHDVNFKGQKISYLENLFDWFSIFSKWRTDAIGISGIQTGLGQALEIALKNLKNIKIRKKLSGFLRKIFYTHPSKELRPRRLKEKYFIEATQNIISKESAIWIGVILGLLFSIAHFYPRQITNLLFQSYMAEVLSFTLLGDFLYYLMTISIPFLFYIPLRNSTSLESSFKKYFVSLTFRFLMIFVAFLVTSVLLSSILYLNEEMYKYYKLADFIAFTAFDFNSIFQVFIGGFFLTSLLAFFHFSSLSYAYNVRRYELKKSILSVGLKFALIIIFSIFLILAIRLSIISVVCSFFVSLLIFFLIGTIFPLLTSYDEMWEVYGRGNLIKKTDMKGLINLSFWQNIFTFFIPMTILSFITNYVASITVYAILIYGSIGILIYSIIKIRKTIRPSYSNVALYLSCIHKYLYLLNFVDSEKIGEDKELIQRRINNSRLEDNSFTIHKRMNVGNTNSTYSAVFSLCTLNYDEEIKDTPKWMLNCENEEGGFSPIEGLMSRLSSTFEALSVLHKFRMIERLDVNIHSKWIKSLQKEEGFFHDGISNYPKLEQTFYALNSLYFLDKIDAIKKGRCIDWVKKTLREGKKDYETVFYSAKCLELLGKLDEKLREEIKDGWLIPQSYALRNIKIDKNLSPFYFYFQVAEIVMEDVKEETKKLLPGLEERAYNSFISYIKEK